MVGHVASGVKAVEVHKAFVDGDEVCLLYDLVLDHRVGRVSVAEHHRLRSGKIAAIRLILDTAPFNARPSAKAEQLAVDPVCTMRIAKSSAAATRTHGGTTYWFCARGCADAFDVEPSRFAR